MAVVVDDKRTIAPLPEGSQRRAPTLSDSPLPPSFFGGAGYGRSLRVKRLILRNVLMISSAQLLLWGAIYQWYGEQRSAILALAWAVVSMGLLACAKREWLSDQVVASVAMLCCLFGNLGFTLLLGGVLVSCGQLIWLVILPISGVLSMGPRAAWPWTLASLFVLGLALFLDPRVVAGAIPADVQKYMLAANVAAPLLLIAGTLYYFMDHENSLLQQLAQERSRSEQLLLNIFPAEVATRLRGGEVIADSFESVSILFVDLANFTKLAASLQPIQLVEILNDLFSELDRIAQRHGVEKIKTIGDCYMAAAGMPQADPNHAVVMADMALAVRAFLEESAVARTYDLKSRIGIGSGPVVAGVIGLDKFAYDLWGDTVNMASRMESHGVVGRIQITRETYEAIKDQFVCEERGWVTVKGIGEVKTWFLVGRKP